MFAAPILPREYLLLSFDAYYTAFTHEHGAEIQERGWQVFDEFMPRNPWARPTTDFFARVYYRQATDGIYDVVLAVRGTSSLMSESLFEDIKLLTGQSVPQFDQGVLPYWKQVKQKLATFNSVTFHGSPIRIHITGHSLGAFLAELLAAKLLTDGEDVTAVTFDGPGSKMHMQHYRYNVATAQQKIISFCAAPHPINAIFERVGAIYRIYPPFDADRGSSVASLRDTQSFAYFLYVFAMNNQHPILNMPALFDRQTGMPNVYSNATGLWPKGSVEMMTYYNNYDLNPHYWYGIIQNLWNQHRVPGIRFETFLASQQKQLGREATSFQSTLDRSLVVTANTEVWGGTTAQQVIEITDANAEITVIAYGNDRYRLPTHFNGTLTLENRAAGEGSIFIGDVLLSGMLQAADSQAEYDTYELRVAGIAEPFTMMRARARREQTTTVTLAWGTAQIVLRDFSGGQYHLALTTALPTLTMNNVYGDMARHLQLSVDATISAASFVERDSNTQTRRVMAAYYNSSGEWQETLAVSASPVSGDPVVGHAYLGGGTRVYVYSDNPMSHNITSASGYTLASRTHMGNVTRFPILPVQSCPPTSQPPIVISLGDETFAIVVHASDPFCQMWMQSHTYNTQGIAQSNPLDLAAVSPHSPVMAGTALPTQGHVVVMAQPHNATVPGGLNFYDIDGDNRLRRQFLQRILNADVTEITSLAVTSLHNSIVVVWTAKGDDNFGYGFVQSFAANQYGLGGVLTQPVKVGGPNSVEAISVSIANADNTIVSVQWSENTDAFVPSGCYVIFYTQPFDHHLQPLAAAEPLTSMTLSRDCREAVVPVASSSRGVVHLMPGTVVPATAVWQHQHYMIEATAAKQVSQAMYRLPAAQALSLPATASQTITCETVNCHSQTSSASRVDPPIFISLPIEITMAMWSWLTHLMRGAGNNIASSTHASLAIVPFVPAATQQSTMSTVATLECQPVMQGDMPAWQCQGDGFMATVYPKMSSETAVANVQADSSSPITGDHFDRASCHALGDTVYCEGERTTLAVQETLQAPFQNLDGQLGLFAIGWHWMKSLQAWWQGTATAELASTLEVLALSATEQQQITQQLQTAQTTLKQLEKEWHTVTNSKKNIPFSIYTSVRSRIKMYQNWLEDCQEELLSPSLTFAEIKESLNNLNSDVAQLTRDIKTLPSGIKPSNTAFWSQASLSSSAGSRVNFDALAGQSHQASHRLSSSMPVLVNAHHPPELLPSNPLAMIRMTH